MIIIQKRNELLRNRLTEMGHDLFYVGWYCCMLFYNPEYRGPDLTDDVCYIITSEEYINME